MQTTKLFRGRKIRALWDKTNKKWLVSAVDICAVVCGSSHDVARNYWKQLKYRLQGKDNPLVRRVSQIRMFAKDGKLRFTDVFDYKKIVQLIQLIPCASAGPFRAWLGSIAAKHSDLVGQLVLAERAAPGGVAEVRKIRRKRLFC